MSLLARLEKKPGVTVGAIVTLLALIVFVVMRNFTATGPTELQAGDYFTTDDGATYFAGTSDQLPPFDVDGKQAFRARLGYQADGKVHVFYLERLNPAGKAALMKAKTGANLTAAEAEALRKAIEYKAVGQSRWQTFDSEFAKIQWTKSLRGTDGKPPIGPI